MNREEKKRTIGSPNKTDILDKFSAFRHNHIGKIHDKYSKFISKHRSVKEKSQSDRTGKQVESFPPVRSE